MRRLLPSFQPVNCWGVGAAVELTVWAWGKGGNLRIRSVQTQMPEDFLGKAFGTQGTTCESGTPSTGAPMVDRCHRLLARALGDPIRADC